MNLCVTTQACAISQMPCWALDAMEALRDCKPGQCFIIAYCKVGMYELVVVWCVVRGGKRKLNLADQAEHDAHDACFDGP